MGYLFYPDLLDVLSFGQYYGEKSFIVYWWYIFLSFLSIFLIFAVVWRKNYQSLVKVEIDDKKRFGGVWYIMFVIFYEIILLAFLIANYRELGYSTQGVMKNSTIWFYMFALNGILMLTLYIKITVLNRGSAKLVYLFLFAVSVLIFMATAIRSGQRIEIGSTLLSFLVFFWYRFSKQILAQKKIILYVMAIILLAGIVFQGIRNSRGGNEGPGPFFAVLRNPDTYSQLFRPEIVIFQDWFVPSLTLVTSIEKDIKIPITALWSDLSLFIPFISHISLGEIISRIIDPDGITGYGYYVLTEGYNLVGFFGFMISAVIFVLGFRLLELFFASTKDNLFNAFMCAIIAYSIIDIIRGQNIFYLKTLYLYFLPSLLFYYLMSGKRISLMVLAQNGRLQQKKNHSAKTN
ncbi:MAG: hypothetical protein WCX69_00645 [Candidatus Paceibacterota bacterium]